MSEISDALNAIRDRLHAQAKDKIGMDDYVAQILAYQHIINDHLNQTIALAELVDTLTTPPTINLPKEDGLS